MYFKSQDNPKQDTFKQTHIKKPHNQAAEKLKIKEKNLESNVERGKPVGNQLNNWSYQKEARRGSVFFKW